MIQHLLRIWSFLIFIGTVLYGSLLSSCTPDDIQFNLSHIQIGSPENPSSPNSNGIMVHIYYPSDFKTEITGSQAYGILSVVDCHTKKEALRIQFYPHSKKYNEEICLKIPSGEYAFLAWVDYRSNIGHSLYQTDDLQQVTISQKQEGKVKEAYSACVFMDVNEKQNQKVNLPLAMPVSRYQFILDEMPKDYINQIILVQQIGYYPITYNVLEGQCTSAILNPKWIEQTKIQSDGKICLYDGVQFVHANHPTTSTYNLFLGNERGNLQYECDGVVLHLKSGQWIKKIMHQKDFWKYTEGNIIDGDFSGDIDIEI